ncbi:MAG: hypothetical protein WA231_09955 [Methylocella sp.]
MPDAAAVSTCTCATFERAEAFATALTRDLARCAALERETMAIMRSWRRLRRAAPGRQWFNPASPAKLFLIRIAQMPR